MTTKDTPTLDPAASVVWLHRECPEYVRVVNECSAALADAILAAPQRHRAELVKTAAKSVALFMRLGDAFPSDGDKEETT